MFGIVSSLLRSTLAQQPVILEGFRSQIRRSITTFPPVSGLSPISPPAPWINRVASTALASGQKPGLSAEEIWANKSKQAKLSLAQQPPATAYSGRSVKVQAGNVGEAYARLQSILQRNRVRAQLRRTERHEKKGEKRRRLESERWRRQFAHEVRKKVQLVTKIRNRGA